jgi:ubiquinone biosynthesis protein COQ4
VEENMKDIINNFKRQPWHDQDGFSRISKLISCSIEAIRDPTRADMVAAVGDLSGTRALKLMRTKMMSDSEGRLILQERPRVKIDNIDFKSLGDLPQNTFGYRYWKFMANYDFKPDERPLVTYVPDMELAYIMQRYKEWHDFIHALLDLGIEIEDELAVKAFEMVQTGIPMTAFTVLTGPFLLSFPQMKRLYIDYFPWINKNALNCKFYMNIYFEKYFEKDVDEFKEELGITSQSL